MNDYVIKYDELSAYEYMELWNSVWDDAPSLEQVDLAMKNTLFRVSIFDKDRLIGMARVIGDKGLSYYIKDVVVIPEYQGKGIGRAIIDTLENDIYFLRARRIEIPASITGVPFYLKMGYHFKDGISEPDNEHIIRMEKNR